MTDKTIPQLSTASSLNASDYMVVEQNGTTKRATLDLLPFTQSGTGTKATDLQTRGRLVLYAEDFENTDGTRVGDDPGVQDDTTGIAAAITEAKSRGARLVFSRKVYKANVTITGQSLTLDFPAFSYWASGTVGIIPADASLPAVQIGDGTTTTRDIVINGLSIHSGPSNTGTKGLRIYGANDIHLNRFTARRFTEYQVQLDSSATLPTYFVFVNGFHIQNDTTSGSLGIDANYGSQYVTGIYFSNGAMNANSGGSHLVDLNGSGLTLRMANVWIEAGNNQGINFASAGTVVDCSNVTIDSSSSNDILATIPTNTSVSVFLRGTFTMDGKITMPGGNTAALSGRYFFPSETTINNLHVEGSLRFLDASANAWDRYSYVTSMNIARAGNNFNIGNSLGNVNVTPVSSGRLNAIAKDLTLTDSGGFGQQIACSHETNTLTTPSGATRTLSNIIPANSLVLGVTVRVTTTITGATSFSVGDGTDADRWGTGIALTAGTTTNIADFTIASPVYYAAATSVVLTAAGSDFTAGATRITVHYIKLTAATS